MKKHTGIASELAQATGDGLQDGPADGSSPELEGPVPLIRAHPPTGLFTEWMELGWSADECEQHWGHLVTLFQAGTLFKVRRQRRPRRADEPGPGREGG